MSLSPNSSLVRRTIDLNYENKQRSASLKWVFVNAVLFLLLTYDLWCACPGYTGSLHYVEACLCAVLCGNVVSHALRLVPRRRAAPRAELSRRQQRLLGLTDEDLDSSFCVAPDSPPRAERASPELSEVGEVASLSPARSWRASASGSPPSPPRASLSPPSLSPRAAPPSPPKDEFIADASALNRYLRERSRAESEGAAWAGGAWAPYAAGPAPPYRLSVGAPPGPTAGAGAGSPGAEADETQAAGPAHLWRRLRLDPHHISQFDLNLRRWLQCTILARLVREMEQVDSALAAAGQEARVGAPLEGAAAAAPPPLAGKLRALLPFLRPFADQSYVCARIRSLARSPCLAAYRWDEGRPTDAELLLHLFATYLDSVVPSGGGGGGGGGGASRGGLAAGSVRVVAARRSPPHYVVVAGEETLEVPSGRNNLLHSLVVFIACVARSDPPALRRLHLGPAGLNLLWVLAR